MDQYRYFIFNQKSVLVLGVLQVACAGLCVVCGIMDAVFRKDTPLSTTRTPIWGGMVMAVAGVLALFASQKKNPILVSALVAAAALSGAAAVFVFGYSCLTLTYGEDDAEVFHHHHSPQVTFVLHRTVKGANATILLCCALTLLLSSAISILGCHSLPHCACYDARTGLETLVPQCDSGDTEMVCTWTADDERLFNSASTPSSNRTSAEHELAQSTLPPYSRLT